MFAIEFYMQFIYIALFIAVSMLSNMSFSESRCFCISSSRMRVIFRNRLVSISFMVGSINSLCHILDLFSRTNCKLKRERSGLRDR